MNQVARADNSAAVARFFKTLSLPSHYFVSWDIAVPSAAFAALDAAGPTNGPRVFQIGTSADGFFFRNPFVPTSDYWTLGTPNGPFSGFTPDTWHTISFEYNAGAITWKIDGSTFDTYTNTITGSSLVCQFGAFTGAHPISDQVYYFDNVKVGTSVGATDIFGDDFESGTLAAWETVIGDVTVVDDPFAGGGPATITLTAAVGSSGDTVSVDGSGFDPSAALSATFDGVPVTLSGTTTTDGSGDFTGALFTVPAIADGTYDVVFTSVGGATATASFEVISVPSNTECGTATVLAGCSGEVTADNRGWAGTWPIGADPLFNAIGEGGGAPLWYRWTNTLPRNMLFRVAVTEPDDHAVDYNLGLNVAADCDSVVFYTDTTDVPVNDGHVFDLNEEGGTRDNYAAADDFDPSITSHFDIVVAPGHTVYLEIDSWTGDASEPPTADAAHRGKFQFGWEALAFTTRDTMQDDGNGSPADTVLADPVNTTYASFDTGPTHFIFPLELVRWGDRLYFLYLYNDEHGDSYYAGDCALDGTDLHTFLFIDKHTTGSTPNPVAPKLMNDGTDIYVGYGWRGTNLVPNPDYPDSCDNHAGETFFCFECEDELGHWRYTLLKFNAGTHAWDAFFSIGENAPDPAWAASLPDYGDISGLSTSYFRCGASAAPEDPGAIWIVMAYQRVRKNQSLHHNDFPTTETPQGALYCTDDRVYMDEVVDIWRIDSADVDGLGGGWTLVSRDSLEIFELQHWDHDDEHDNPLFNPTWQHFDQGNFYTDPGGTTYPSILRDHLSMVSDEGYPILAYNPITSEDNTGPALIPATDVVIERLDTAAVLQDWNVSDISLGVETPANAPTGVSLTPRYFNPETETYERGLSTTWHSVSSVPVGWLVRVPSDVSAAPTYINPADTASSGANGDGLPLASVLYKDTKLGQFISGWTGEILVYEYCEPTWERTFFGVGATQYFAAPVFYWDADTEDAYYLADRNIIGKTHMLRDFWICEDGEPCVPGAIAGLRHHRQRLGVAA